MEFLVLVVIAGFTVWKLGIHKPVRWAWRLRAAHKRRALERRGYVRR
jgi:hypothetical protein